MRPGADLTWPQLNVRALETAYAAVADGQTWCLFSYARAEMSAEESSNQHAMLIDGLSRPSCACDSTRVLTMVAHYRADGVFTRWEPWLFVIGNVRLGLAAWLCSRFGRPTAFWGDRSSISALAPDADRDRSPWGALARSLGAFRAGAIAHAICESSSDAATFLGFDLPVSSLDEALARTLHTRTRR